MKTLIGVIGSSKIIEPAQSIAYELGHEIMRAGYSLICGGLGGVMEAACRGAYDEAGPNSGRIIGVLPGITKSDANPYIDIVIPTGIGHVRNMIIACAADAVIAVSGESGTLSEMAMAWNYGKPVIVMENLPGIPGELIGKSLDIEKGLKKIAGAKSAAEALILVKKFII
jgi:uncharacterized protein (TIGR00725 family)